MADHTNYRELMDKGVEKIQKDTETKAGSYAFAPQNLGTFKVRLKGVLNQERIHAIGRQHELRTQHSRSQGARGLELFATQAASAETPALRNHFESLGRELIADHGNSNVISRPQEYEWNHRFGKSIAAGRINFFDTDLQNANNERVNKARRDPINAENHIAEGFRAIDNAAGDWLPADKVAEVKRNHSQNVWFSAVSTLVDQNPITAKAQLKIGKYDDKLAPQHLAALNNHADQLIDHMARRMEAERKAAEVQIGAG